MADLTRLGLACQRCAAAKGLNARRECNICLRPSKQTGRRDPCGAIIHAVDRLAQLSQAFVGGAKAHSYGHPFPVGSAKGADAPFGPQPK